MAEDLSGKPSGEKLDDLDMDGSGMGLYSEDDYDPLKIDDNMIDQDEMDDDNPYDTIDYPTVREMPKGMHRSAVFSPEVQGSAVNAIRALIKNNPARRPVILNILALCEGGCLSSVISEKVAVWQKDNRSVYEPMTFCRMLERAGGLTLDMPETTTEHEIVEDGVTYLEIKDEIDPVWHTTEAGMEICEEYSGGAQFREKIIEGDSKYLEVYEAVMKMVDERPRTKQEIEDFVATFEVVKNPPRFGNHFIDMLELTDALVWGDHFWHLTDLGRKLIDEVSAARGENA